MYFLSMKPERSTGGSKPSANKQRCVECGRMQKQQICLSGAVLKMRVSDGEHDSPMAERIFEVANDCNRQLTSERVRSHPTYCNCPRPVRRCGRGHTFDMERMSDRAQVAIGISTFAINFCEFHFLFLSFRKIVHTGTTDGFIPAVALGCVLI